MRGIFIDSTCKNIFEVDFEGNYRDIQRMIGCQCFTVIELSNGNALYIDDEGLLNDPEYFFGLTGPDFVYPQPLAGNGLILGTNSEGESIATDLSLDTIKANVKFTRLRVKDWTETKTEENVDMPYGGKGFVIHGPQPIFEKRKD